MKSKDSVDLSGSARPTQIWLMWSTICEQILCSWVETGALEGTDSPNNKLWPLKVGERDEWRGGSREKRRLKVHEDQNQTSLGSNWQKLSGAWIKAAGWCVFCVCASSETHTSGERTPFSPHCSSLSSSNCSVWVVEQLWQTRFMFSERQWGWPSPSRSSVGAIIRSFREQNGELALFGHWNFRCFVFLCNITFMFGRVAAWEQTDMLREFDSSRGSSESSSRRVEDQRSISCQAALY